MGMIPWKIFPRHLWTQDKHLGSECESIKGISLLLVTFAKTQHLPAFFMPSGNRAERKNNCEIYAGVAVQMEEMKGF